MQRSSARLTFTEVKAKVSMDELLTYYGWDGEEIRGWNDWMTIRCPFHDDHNPSARYHLFRDRFDCFACDIHGDIFDVVQAVEGYIDVTEAKAWIESNLLDM